MKVGTDAVLLGAWMPLPENCSTILEIGSGCGVISFMLAQRTSAQITGIDIDEKSVIEAQKNAENCIWNDRMQFIHENAQDFVQKTTQKFDVIVSNPPFFENSLKSPKTSRNMARHNDTLSLEVLISTVDTLLSDNGRFGIILPLVAEEKLRKFAFEKHLYATKKTWVYPTATKKANRMLMMFERENKFRKNNSLTIRNGDYTDEYLKLVEEYLIITN